MKPRLRHKYAFPLFALLAINVPTAILGIRILQLPHAALFVRNTIFVRPLTLPALAQRVSAPPSSSLSRMAAQENAAQALVREIRVLCPQGQHQCLATTLAARLATLPRSGGCGLYATESALVGGVLKGGGCCSDVVKTYLLLAAEMGVHAREVHVPRHTTSEYWDPLRKNWIWIDPFLGFQAHASGRENQTLSHLEVFRRFLAGDPVDVQPIRSPWPEPIRPPSGFQGQGHLPSDYQYIFYTPQRSWVRSVSLSNWLGRTGMPKLVRELILYLVVKPPLYVSGVGQNFFLLKVSRWLLVLAMAMWLTLNILIATWMVRQLRGAGQGPD